MSVELQQLIGGRWIAGTGSPLEDRSPADPSVLVAAGPHAGPDQVPEAVAAARAAARAWAAEPVHRRAAVLVAAAEIVEANADAWGAELTAEEGKTLPEGIGEVRRAAQILRYCAGAADREAGSIFHSPRPGEQILVTRRPLGVVAAITPFNFPVAIPAWKIAPALIHGNAVVWKPAASVPLLAQRLASALHDAGLPAGVLALLIGDDAVGRALVEHPGIDAITFTGSTGVGRAVAAAGAARGVPVQAEMGGKNAAVVLADADLGLAVDQVMAGAFRSTGQKCTATSRLVLDEMIADEFLSLLSAGVTALRVGDPAEPGVDVGPVIDAAARSRIEAAVAAAVERGARIVVAGATGAGSGHYCAPTVLELDDDDRIWRDELFGPVVAVRRAASVDEAFALANDGEYGLSVAVFTRDLGIALRASTEIETGIVHVNSESAGADPHVPFGGAKRSGYGPSEQGEASREFFTHACTTYLRGGAQ
ncbi:MAG: aldehyde dehydrogenase family protein [Gordonia sp. (in: high G+C Gram-positive bacteria)]|uniref:aldehyde dehydrogenase family protein n=1 Tax=Gordonia sp. (in: high G+C Gram-positive bacteria) TaxID=84139 RepID=UPI0039E6394D